MESPPPQSGSDGNVIAQLEATIAQLDVRLEELQKLSRAPGGPFHERGNRQALVFERISSMNIRIFNLQQRLFDRERAKAATAEVPELPAERVKAMQDALEQVSKSIAEVENFRAKLTLARAISDASSEAASASAMSTA